MSQSAFYNDIHMTSMTSQALKSPSRLRSPKRSMASPLRGISPRKRVNGFD